MPACACNTRRPTVIGDQGAPAPLHAVTARKSRQTYFGATSPDGNPFKDRVTPYHRRQPEWHRKILEPTEPSIVPSNRRLQFDGPAFLGARSGITHEIVFLTPTATRRVLHRYIESRARLKALALGSIRCPVVDANCDAGLGARTSAREHTLDTSLLPRKNTSKSAAFVVNWRFINFYHTPSNPSERMTSPASRSCRR